MANRAWARTVSASALGHTKIRAAISGAGLPALVAASCTIGATVETSSADSQLMMAPSPSRPAMRNMPGRRAATRIGGACSGFTPRRNPLMSKLS